MRNLIAVLITFSFAFSIDELHLQNGTIYNGLYTGTADYKVFFKVEDSFTVQAVYLAIMNFIIDDGIKITKLDLQTQNAFLLKSKEETIDSKKGYIGGLFIVAGGGLLYSNIDKQLNDDETFEEFADRLEGTTKLGYGLIILGGI